MRKITKETREKMSISQIGHEVSEETKRKISETRKRRTKEGKINAYWKGKAKTELHRKKISQSMKGKHTSPKTQFKKGKVPWIKGKKGKLNPLYGRIRAKYIGEKISKAKMGHKVDKKTREKMSKYRRNQILPKKDSSIEVKIQNFLSLLHLEFYTHKYMKIEHGYQCDIFIPKQEGIPKKTVIECDGCYWHGCPICNHKNKLINLQKRRELDNQRKNELEDKGFKVIRLWEHEIKSMELNNFREKLV